MGLCLASRGAHPPDPLCFQASSPEGVFSSSAGTEVTLGVWAPQSGWR